MLSFQPNITFFLMLKMFTFKRAKKVSLKSTSSIFALHLLFCFLFNLLLHQNRFWLPVRWFIHWLTVTLFFTDIAATEQIAEILMRAEEFWVQRQTDPLAPPPQSEEHCTEPNQDNNLPVKKLYVLIQWITCFVTEWIFHFESIGSMIQWLNH